MTPKVSQIQMSELKELYKIITSSARAEISDGPHKGGLRRAGPNNFMFVYNLVQRDLSISMFFVFIFLFCYSCFLFFCNLSTIHNLATYTL